jgi:pilus assembly protein CpaD
MKNDRIRFTLFGMTAALVSGCAMVNGPEHAMTYAERHPITVDTQVVTMTIDVSAAEGDLSSLDRSRLRAFADAYLTNGHGPLSITVPASSHGDRLAERRAAAIRSHLNEAGVDWSQLPASTYALGNASGRQIILSYTHYVATASACGDFSGQLMRDYRNLRTVNFGCATQNNLAAMVADPRDLVTPADSAPPDAQARIRALRAYRAGEVTSSAKDRDIEASISDK